MGHLGCAALLCPGQLRGVADSEAEWELGTRNSDTSYLILDDDDRTRPWKLPPAPGVGGTEDQDTFVMPLLETTSSFKPNDFESKLLPPENKPLETSMLRACKRTVHKQ